MKRKIAAGIVKMRIVILVLMVILACVCAASVGRTRINYDLTRYLKKDTMTQRALKVMQAEFGSSEQIRIMFHDLDDDMLGKCIQALNDLEEVNLADLNPAEDIRTVEGVTYQLVTVTLKECDAPALVERIRQMFPQAGDYAVGGSAAAQLDVQESVAREMPEVMLIAVAVVLAVLLLTSHAWLEPVVILIVLALSILINMGTNFIFSDVSFITFAVSAILQLALSIDYAIMLLHSYNAWCDTGLSSREAMVEAVTQTAMPIFSSALTTVAGLLSLLFMSFTIGFDIGLVLSKGILISMVSVFLLMPAVTLIFGKALRATRHRPVRLGGDRVARGIYRVRKPAAVLLIAAVLAGAYLQSANTYLFTDVGQSGKGESQEVSRVFGASNPMVLLVPSEGTDEDYNRQRALVERLGAIEIQGARAVKEISAMVTTGAQALEYYTARDVAKMTGINEIAVNLFFTVEGFGSSVRADRLLNAASRLAGNNEMVQRLQTALSMAQAAFNSGRYTRMLLEMNYSVSDERTRPAIDEMLSIAREFYGEEAYLTGVPMSTYDIGNAFEGDLMKVNLITLAVIFLIVALSFRSLRMPIVLVFVIEGAIWITMGLSRALHQPIFFMSYLICVSIQMGATIDYGILLSDTYRTLRRTLPVREALAEAMKKSLPTILTSGTILVTAGFIIGKRCSVYYISAIGLLLSRGALISVLLILTLLPTLLALWDGFLLKKEKR